MTQVEEIFARDERIAYIDFYPEGFVANAYGYKCTRTKLRVLRDGTEQRLSYDAKRSHGRGPNWVAFSAAHGRLASG